MALKNVFVSFCQKFGGGTVNPVLNGWMDDKGELVSDKIGIVYSYVPELTSEVKKFIKALAVEVRETLHEDAITVVFDDEAEFY